MAEFAVRVQHAAEGEPARRREVDGHGERAPRIRYDRVDHERGRIAGAVGGPVDVRGGEHAKPPPGGRLPTLFARMYIPPPPLACPPQHPAHLHDLSPP